MKLFNTLVVMALCVVSCQKENTRTLPYVQPSVTDSQGNTTTSQRLYISHRGVDMGCTVAGENSLEAIALAAGAGFDCIETDCRETSDGVLVCMHDDALNRTCLRADGTSLTEKVPVASVTLEQLKTDYRIKATREDMRSAVPTLTEYLTCCKENGIFPFIEPKLKDESGENYRRIISEADAVLGRGNYIVTSNNFANTVIRETLGVSDVRVMSILYQTTFEAIQGLGNSIMAISATRYDNEEYALNVERAVKAGLLTESSADKFQIMDKINKAQINYVSTDYLLPDYKGQGTLVCEFKKPAQWSGLPDGEQTFGAYFLQMTYKGSAEVTLGRQSFTVSAENGIDAGDGYRTICYQLLLFQETPKAGIKATSADFQVKKSNLKFVVFE